MTRALRSPLALHAYEIPLIPRFIPATLGHSALFLFDPLRNRTSVVQRKNWVSPRSIGTARLTALYLLSGGTSS